ncbi:MAG: hypothetical protein A2W19_05375 [Spirochaetes bacterium RBG_16_49_21]|nr:MAG: hypothetical protein A2W19_05375 [Spirochaetes bacterium RBG_16_49_21]
MEKYVLKIYPMGNFLSQKLFKRNISPKTFYQLFKHYLVGFNVALLNYVIFVLLKHLNLDTKIANSITYIFIIALSFLLQKFYTYEADHHSIWQPILFLVNALMYYVLDTAMLVVMIDHIAIVPGVAKIFSIGTLAPLSFLSQKYIVFKNRGDRKKDA